MVDRVGVGLYLPDSLVPPLSASHWEALVERRSAIPPRTRNSRPAARGDSWPQVLPVDAGLRCGTDSEALGVADIRIADEATEIWNAGLRHLRASVASTFSSLRRNCNAERNKLPCSGTA